MEKLKKLLDASVFITDEYKNSLLENVKNYPENEEKLIKIFETSNENWEKTWKDYLDTNKKISDDMIKDLTKIEYLDKEKTSKALKAKMKKQEASEKENEENILSQI